MSEKMEEVEEKAEGNEVEPSPPQNVEAAPQHEDTEDVILSGPVDTPAPLTDDFEDPKITKLADIHKTFSNVINEFRGDKSAERFMEEYEKLYEALKKSHRDNKSLQYRCAHLQSEIKNNTEKVNLAIHLSQEDRGMIATLNKQMQEAWALVDVMNDREHKAKSAVVAMKEEIQVLTSLVEEGMGMGELQNLADKAAAERKALEDQLQEQKEENDAATSKLVDSLTRHKDKEQSLETEVRELKAIIENMKMQSEENKAKEEQTQNLCNRLTRQVDRLRADKARLDVEIEGWKKKLKKTEERYKELQNEFTKMSKQFTSEKERSNALNGEKKSLKDKIERMTFKEVQQAEKIEALQLKDKRNKKDIDIKMNELRNSQINNQILTNQCKKLTDELKSLKACLSSCQDEHRVDIGNLKQLDMELKDNQAKLDATLLKNNNLISQASSAQEHLLKAKAKNVELDLTLRANIKVNTEMMNEMTNMNESMKRISETVNAMVAEKDRLLRKINQGLNKIIKLEEEMITKDNLMLMAEKSRVETEHTLKLTQESLVHALNQRDVAASTLAKVEVMNSYLTNAKQNMTKQIRSVSEEAAQMEKKVGQLMREKDKMQDDLNEVHNLLIDEQLLNKKNKIRIKTMQKDVQNMEYLLNQAQAKVASQHTYIEGLTTQRNILGLQCVRKKEEVAMLIEKNKVLEDIMNMGNKLYDARLQEVAYLKRENIDLYRQKHNVMKQLECVENMRSKLGLANQQLVVFQAKCKTLEGESINNIHNHRHLKAKDMSKFEMVLKIQHLTKRLILKSMAVATLEGNLKEKAMILDNMKQELGRMPGNYEEVVNRARFECHQKEKMQRKLKVALAEANLLEWKAQDREEERDKLKNKLDEEKKKRLQQSKKFQKEKERGLLPPIPTAFGRSDDPAGLQLDVKKTTKHQRS